jgi:hypothetical protein
MQSELNSMTFNGALTGEIRRKEGVMAYEMAVRLPVKNLFLRSVLVYIPTMGLTFVRISIVAACMSVPAG